MLTARSFFENLVFRIEAAVYLFVFLFLVVYLCYEAMCHIKFRMKERKKKDVKNRTN